MRFGPDEEQGFEAARRSLLDRYETDRRNSQPEPDLFVASLMLEYRWGYGDGRIVDWSRGDVQDFLGDWLPRKATLSPQDIDEVPGDMRAFLEWLDRVGLLGGEALSRLLTAVDATTPAFRSAAVDPSRRGVAGRVVAAMMAEGVDPTDEGAIDRWMAGFNQRPIAERDRILGFDQGRPDDDLDADDLDEESWVGDREPLPVVELAPTTELAAAATASVTLGRLTTVTRFLAQRRKLTQKGHLNLADGRALATELGVDFEARYGDLAWPVRSSGDVYLLTTSFRWARGAGFIKVRLGWASATARGTALGKRPNEDWLAAFTAWVEGKVKDEHGSWTHDHLEELSQDLPMHLYRSGPLTVTQVGDLAVELFDLEYGRGAVTQGGLDPRPWLREGITTWTLEPLVELGAITVTDDSVALTPLGRWGTNRWLRAQGVDAPVMGEFAESTAEVLLAACAERSLEAAEAEIRAWIAAREGPGVAALRLGEVAGDGGDLALLAFHALSLVGPEAEPVVRDLVDSPVRGQALVWLSQHGFEDPETLPTDLLQGMLVGTFAVTLDREGAEALVARLQDLGPDVEQIRWVEDLERVDEARVNDLLAAIGRQHPSRPVAKAARAALFKRKGLRLS